LTERWLILRPRLVELMTARWCRRLVVVVAGPGFGKSVLLAQAAAENNLARRGVDVMVRCTDADAGPGHLARRIAEAIGLPEATDRSTVDEWCEPAHRVLIAVALARGDRGGAAKALIECQTMLESLGVRPDPQTQMLRRHVLAAAPTTSGGGQRTPPPCLRYGPDEGSVPLDQPAVTRASSFSSDFSMALRVCPAAI
jgi:hypothetical protein